MLLYRLGKIIHVNKKYIIFESDSAGYTINITRAENFEKDRTLKLYIYELSNEYQKTLYGFTHFKERVLFEDLISINGIGPRIALILLNDGWEKIASLIANGNWETLSRYPYINVKNCHQIIFELQNKWAKFLEKDEKVTSTNIQNISDATETLKMLGFKREQIKYALESANLQDDVETLVENAIKKISTVNGKEARN